MDRHKELDNKHLNRRYSPQATLRQLRAKMYLGALVM
jgi:hypothetical protein